jgi:hypothetical protein
VRAQAFLGRGAVAVVIIREAEFLLDAQAGIRLRGGLAPARSVSENC